LKYPKYIIRDRVSQNSKSLYCSDLQKPKMTIS